MRLVPSNDVKHKILTEINYTSLVSIENTNDKNEIEKIVLIKIPTEIYPNIFDTFVYLFAQAGIKNLSIDKMASIALKTLNMFQFAQEHTMKKVHSY